jgi:hypothetical protein
MLLVTRETPAAGRQATPPIQNDRGETMKTRVLLALAGLAAALIRPAFSQDEVTPEMRQQIEALNQKSGYYADSPNLYAKGALHWSDGAAGRASDRGYTDRKARRYPTRWG